MNKMINILAAFGLSIFILLAINVGQASAINYTGPDENDFTPASPSNMMFEVARYCIGCGGALEAPDSTVVVYLRTSSGTINIINGYQNCAGDNYNAPTTFQFFRGDNPIGAPAAPSVPDSAMNCTSYPVFVSGLPSVVIGSETFYTVTVRAVHMGTQGINAFEVHAPTNGIVSYYSGSGEYFTIQDRNSASTGNSTFNLKFGTSCDITTDTPATLRWVDDDHISGGGNWNQTSADNFRWEVYESRKDGTGRVRIAYLNFDGTTDVATSGWVGDDQGPTFGDENGWANITVKPNYRYEWIWYGVRKTNGVNFQVPHNSIFYLYQCGNWDYVPTIINSSVPTTANPGATITPIHNNINVGSATGPAWLRAIHVSSGASYVTRLTSWGNDSGTMARQYGVAGLAPGVPSARGASYLISPTTPDGTVICWYARVAGTDFDGTAFTESSTPPECLTVINPAWNYTIVASGSPPETTPNFPKPGNSITINSTVTNDGAGTGAAYEHRFVVTQGGGNLVNSADVRYTGQAGLAAGAMRSQAAAYQIVAAPADGDQVCFQAWVAPFSGFTFPSPPPITSTGWRESGEICYTIYNERFDLNLVIAMPTQAFPGEDINISYSVCNQTDDERNLIAPAPGTATRGDSSPTTMTTSGDLNPGLTGNTNQTIANADCWDNFDRPIKIPLTAVVGDELCTTLTSSRNHGFSDGTDLGGHPVSLQECLVIADGPYLQVFGHDTWAGGGYSLDGSCAVSGAGDILSNARQRLNSSGTPVTPQEGVGAMDQYAAFADATVSDFGTANDALTSTLTFANTSGLGSFGAERCLYNLFDSGGAGGNIDDGLWNNADDLGSDINGISSAPPEGGQYSYNNDATITGGGAYSNLDKNVTVLINGSLDIRQNITLNTSSLAIGDIPLLVFIVTGDIRIQNTVSRIDGIYISLSQIDTCNTFGSGSLSPVNDLTAGTPCNGHLEVNGSLIASDIAFRRTYGGTNEAATDNTAGRCNIPAGLLFNYNSGGNNTRCSAETIIFPPWFWLADPHLDRGESSSSSQYPIQQIRDLPPIF